MSNNKRTDAPGLRHDQIANRLRKQTFKKKFQNHLYMVTLVLRYLNSKRDKQAWHMYIQAMQDFSNRMTREKNRFTIITDVSLTTLGSYNTSQALRYVLDCYYRLTSDILNQRDFQYEVDSSAHQLGIHIQKICSSRSFLVYFSELIKPLHGILRNDLQTEYAKYVLAFLFQPKHVTQQSILDLHKWLMTESQIDLDEHLVQEHLHFVQNLYLDCCEHVWQNEVTHSCDHDTFIARAQQDLAICLTKCPTRVKNNPTKAQGIVNTIATDPHVIRTDQSPISRKSSIHADVADATQSTSDNSSPGLSAFFLQQYAIQCMKQQANYKSLAKAPNEKPRPINPMPQTSIVSFKPSASVLSATPDKRRVNKPGNT